jgi:hypothetical protein
LPKDKVGEREPVDRSAAAEVAAARGAGALLAQADKGLLNGRADVTIVGMK